MKIREVRFWIAALPILSLIVAGSTVGLQYARRARLTREMKAAVAEEIRLEPKSADAAKGRNDRAAKQADKTL